MGDVGGADKNGVVKEDHSVIKNPDPSTISKDYWDAAEKAIQEVINCIHPNLGSEEKRKDVIDFMQRLLKCSLGFEAFPFGSVPLKTYLPDGDIDLTVFSNPCVEESWFSGVLSVLQREEQNEYAEFEVKDTQFIDAEVKVVKCIVQNIVIDISFNQLGGISTLCFLEQVDRLVGKNHLFKRSIILIKAWCYYESRTLASNHGLLSTYAMETLVLCIFQLFHSSLDGPFAVLYRFLDYFSKFDWENYCVSVNGPVRKSSLPDIVVEMPENHGNNLMLGEEFFRNCMEMFTVPSRDSDSNSRSFPPKHLNIIDPLRENNNLGRSVHRGNFYRIRSALKYGARKLGRIMSSPEEEGIADEIKKFFSSTLQRHLYKNSWDSEGSKTLSSSESFSEDILLRTYCGDFEGLGTQEKGSSVESAASLRQLSRQKTSDLGYSVNGLAVSGICSNGASYDYAACNSLNFRGLNGASDRSSTLNVSNLYFEQSYYPPQFYLYKPSAENGPFYETGTSDGLQGKLEVNPCLEDGENHLYMGDTCQSCLDNLDSYFGCNSAVSSPKTSLLESLPLDIRERDTSSTVDTEPFNPLADLTGDYDSHIRSLSYWKCCHDLALFAPVVSVAPALPSQFPREKAWEPVHQPFPFRPSSYSLMNSSPIIMEPPASVSIRTSVYAPEGNSNSRGTGMPLPSMKSSSRDRPLPGRTRDKAPGSHVQTQRDTCSSGYAPCFVETSSSGKGSPREASNVPIPSQTHKKSAVIIQSNNSKEGDARTSGNFSKSLSNIEFGSLGPLADEVISDAAYSNGQTSPIALQDKGKPASGSNTKERDGDSIFHLKNDEEFPALSA